MDRHNRDDNRLDELRDVSQRLDASLTPLAALRAVVNLMVDGLAIATKNGKFTHVEDGFAAAFGFEPNDLIGHDVEMVVPERHRLEHVHWRDGWNRKPVKLRAVNGFNRKDGEITVEVGLAPLPNGDVLIAVRNVR